MVEKEMTDEIIINADDLMKIYEAELLRRYESQATMSDDLIKALQKELREADERIAELEAALKPLAEVAERYAYCKPRAEEDDVVMFELMYFNQARKVLGEKK